MQCSKASIIDYAIEWAFNTTYVMSIIGYRVLSVRILLHAVRCAKSSVDALLFGESPVSLCHSWNELEIVNGSMSIIGSLRYYIQEQEVSPNTQVRLNRCS